MSKKTSPCCTWIASTLREGTESDGHEVEHVDALGLHPVHQPFKLGGEKTQDGRFQTAFIRDRIRFKLPDQTASFVLDMILRTVLVTKGMAHLI